MTLNSDLIRSRCTEIEESVERLERLAALSREAFLADQDALDIACYRLLLAIEAALALCYHVSAKHLNRVPDEYAECFGLLGDAGIIPASLMERLQQMARFRNLLVHVYWKIDYGQVHEIIRQHLGDLRSFASAIVKLI
ncbi:MAG: DUF86 domain-containing protein [bacterium]|uniref:DUF86 domain-containing protein n=1 Tax=Candidatus Methylomirabilis tolerans TaxID=3123416 RepID=A0AAJ1AK74_9BACT|nr:DUF86 domain-containing protein [Candidatus Methylomirabilis sp.]